MSMPCPPSQAHEVICGPHTLTHSPSDSDLVQTCHLQPRHPRSPLTPARHSHLLQPIRLGPYY